MRYVRRRSPSSTWTNAWSDRTIAGTAIAQSILLGHTSGSIEHVALKGPHYKAASARAYSLIEQYKFIACSFHVANQGINNMNIINRIFRLSVAVGVGCAALIATVPASADVARYQILTLQYDSVDYYLPASGPYSQSFTLTFNPCNGTVSGPGLVPGFGVSLTQGSINGALLSYTSTYNVEPGYTVTVNNAVVLNDYSFSGLWSDNYSVGAQSGVVVSNIPGVTSTAYRNHGDFVSQSLDKNDAAHSCIGMPIPKQ